MSQRPANNVNQQLLEEQILRQAPHLCQQDAVALATAVVRLLRAYHPERVYLFGSKSRGDAGPDSDYDLMLVVPDDASPERGRSRLAYELLWDVGIAADVLVWKRATFDRQLGVVASLPSTVLREGKLLYAA